MGLLTPNEIKNLESLYNLQLRYLLSAENQIIEGLDSMIQHATDTQLKQAFQSHQQETRVQAERLESLLSELNGSADDKKCAVTAALIVSAENIVKESDEGPVRDAGLLASGQKVEHFEIASYGAAKNWALQIGLPRHAELLEKTLQEEKHADMLLNTIAERANSEAAVSA